jgi:co-chaperonin GroES (HSP10)
MTTVTPLRNRIYIAEAKKKEESASGIILTSDRGGDTAPAIALAVGPDVKSVKVNDRLLVDWSKSAAVTVDGIQRAVIKEEDVIAVFED